MAVRLVFPRHAGANLLPTNDPASSYWDNPQTGPLPPVLIVGDDTTAKPAFQSAVNGKYTSQEYVLRWWFPEETYRDSNNNADFGKAISNLWSPQYLLYRNPVLPLGSTNFNLYVKNDIAVKTGLAAPVSAAPVPTNTGPAAGMYDLTGAGAGNGQFNLPRGIARDGNGFFYVVDAENLRVEKFDSTGKFVLAFGSKGTATASSTRSVTTIRALRLMA